MNKRILASALLALVLMAAVVAPVAAAMQYCFQFKGKLYCIDIPVQYHIFYKIPPDPGPYAIDVSRVMAGFEEVHRSDRGQTQWLNALVENHDTQWYLIDAKGEHVVLLDMANQAAVEVPTETQVGY
jgi:hypothetical protein